MKKKIIAVVMALAMILTAFLGVTAQAKYAQAKPAENSETYSMIWHQSLIDRSGALETMGGLDRTAFLDIKAGADGSALRFRFDNRQGKREGEIPAMTVWVNNVCYPVTVGGKQDIRVPAGQQAVSDPVSVTVKRNDPIEVRAFYHTARVGSGTTSEEGVFTKKGNQTATNYGGTTPESQIEKQTAQIATVPLLSAIEIKGAPVQSIVVLGDSIVAMNRWTAPLEQRVSDYYGGKYVVLNSGISSNCLLYERSGIMGQIAGETGMKRFARDVLELTNVHTVILSEGTNDIGNMTADNGNVISVEKLIAATTQLAKELHARGIRVVGQTITPRNGYRNFTAQQEQFRQQYNAWLRSTDIFDYLIDFDECVRDPAHPENFREGLHQGDHLHPSVEGGKVMADFVDLNKLV